MSYGTKKSKGKKAVECSSLFHRARLDAQANGMYLLAEGRPKDGTEKWSLYDRATGRIVLFYLPWQRNYRDNGQWVHVENWGEALKVAKARLGLSPKQGDFE
jgi:hypothetical protein